MICKTWERVALAVMAALVVAIFAAPGAQADPILTVTNGDFAQYTGVTPGTNNDYFTNVNPTGWTGGGNLIFVTSYTGINNPSLYLPVYGPTAGQTASIPANPFPNSPIGGNFVEADANPDYEDSFSYQLSGLTPGQTYQLSFFVAYGEQTGFSSPGGMTNQWLVGLGVPGSVFSTTSIGGGYDSYSYSDPNGSVATTPLTSVPNEGVSPWQQVTVYLTADAANDVLTFLAWGNNGSTSNVPPIAFLDIGGNGNLTAATPTPPVAAGGLVLLVVVMVGFGANRLRRRRSNPGAV